MVGLSFFAGFLEGPTNFFEWSGEQVSEPLLGLCCQTAKGSVSAGSPQAPEEVGERSEVPRNANFFFILPQVMRGQCRILERPPRHSTAPVATALKL